MTSLQAPSNEVTDSCTEAGMFCNVDATSIGLGKGWWDDVLLGCDIP